MNTGYYFLYGSVILLVISLILAVYCNIKDWNRNCLFTLIFPWFAVAVAAIITVDVYQKIVIQWGWPFWG